VATRKDIHDEIKAAHDRDKLATEIYETGYNEGKAEEKTAYNDAVDKALSSVYNPDTGKYEQPKPQATPQAAVEAATTPNKELVSQDLLNQILDRKEFTYDANADPLYQQYKEQYLNAGKKAMQDTLGKATALTGGYGNSYASAVAQETYDDYASKAAEKIPELYQLAMQKYQMEGDLLNNKYSLLYGKERDAISDEQWQAQFDEGVRQFDLSRADQREQFALNYNLDVRKFEEGVRQFGLEHALELAKYDRSIFESDRDYDRSVLESDRAYDRSVLESDRDYALNSYKVYNSGSGSGSGSGGSKSSSSTATTVDRVNKNGIKTNTQEKFDAAVQAVYDYAMNVNADSDDEALAKVETYAKRYEDWGTILDAVNDMIEIDEDPLPIRDITKTAGRAGGASQRTLMTR